MPVLLVSVQLQKYDTSTAKGETAEAIYHRGGVVLDLDLSAHKSKAEFYCSSLLSAVNHFCVQSLHTVTFLRHQMLLPTQNPSDRIKLLTSMLVEPVGYFKRNLEFEWLNSYITGKCYGGFFIREGKKRPTTN